MESAVIDFFDSDIAYSYHPDRIYRYKNPKTILLGKQGSGKTTFFNKATGSQEAANEGVDSIT